MLDFSTATVKLNQAFAYITAVNVLLIKTFPSNFIGLSQFVANQCRRLTISMWTSSRIRITIAANTEKLLKTCKICNMLSLQTLKFRVLK